MRFYLNFKKSLKEPYIRGGPRRHRRTSRRFEYCARDNKAGASNKLFDIDIGMEPRSTGDAEMKTIGNEEGRAEGANASCSFPSSLGLSGIRFVRVIEPMFDVDILHFNMLKGGIPGFQ